MTDKNLLLNLAPYKINGVVHVGAGKGEYARYYHRLGVHQVLWVEKKMGLYSDLYLGTRNFGMIQKILIENLSNKTDIRAKTKTFKDLWREHAASINVETNELLHLACKNNQTEVLTGLEEMLGYFKYVIISKKDEDETANLALEAYLGNRGFSLDSFAGENSEERFFVRK
jgi:hypothetical protein